MLHNHDTHVAQQVFESCFLTTMWCWICKHRMSLSLHMTRSAETPHPPVYAVYCSWCFISLRSSVLFYFLVYSLLILLIFFCELLRIHTDTVISDNHHVWYCITSCQLLKANDTNSGLKLTVSPRHANRPFTTNVNITRTYVCCSVMPTDCYERSFIR